MTSTSISRGGLFGRESEEFDPTAASPTASHEPRTGRTPTAWAAGREDESQSATFRALAWSQEDDSIAECLPYIGEEFAVSELNSRQTVQFAEDAAGSLSAPRFSRSALLSGIVAGFAAAAVGGLLLTVVNADITPPTTSPTVIQRAENLVVSPPSGEPAHQGSPIRPSAPAVVNAAGAPARAVPPAVTPAPTVRAFPPASQKPSAPEAPAPEVTAAPELPAPAVTAPQVMTPQAKPPVLVVPPELPPLVTSPIVSVPEVTPQPVPHPVGPIVIRVPTVSDPAIPAPAAPAASNPGISLKPGVTIPVAIPTLSPGAGQ
ncbi:MAG: hypothetical protein NT146_16660 [Mycobacterium sp.]|nr:hypothetical protein [Mycobacterium sp.]